ncbi:glutathione S-transferase N-terminal domain-containing protein [Mesorhizobium sp. M0018]|uniref:glutathione S-transferase N-terminal domain-containing protein n=1 Tax=unclassified Mesorhizobium TaxID=325217 RepID=UPI00333CAB01
MLRIYGYAGSINVRKVLWACVELDLAFEPEDWGGSHRPISEPLFRALNPVAMVPVIDDAGTIVWESNAIIRYLAASREAVRRETSSATGGSTSFAGRWMRRVR